MRDHVFRRAKNLFARSWYCSSERLLRTDVITNHKSGHPPFRSFIRMCPGVKLIQLPTAPISRDERRESALQSAFVPETRCTSDHPTTVPFPICEPRPIA